MPPLWKPTLTPDQEKALATLVTLAAESHLIVKGTLGRRVAGPEKVRLAFSFEIELTADTHEGIMNAVEKALARLSPEMGG